MEDFSDADAQRPHIWQHMTVSGLLKTAVYNKQLSKYRADMVKNYLIGQGISASRIDVFGRGAQNPLKSNTSFEGRKQNRRVEIKVSDN